MYFIILRIFTFKIIACPCLKNVCFVVFVDVLKMLLLLMLSLLLLLF